MWRSTSRWDRFESSPQQQDPHFDSMGCLTRCAKGLATLRILPACVDHLSRSETVCGLAARIYGKWKKLKESSPLYIVPSRTAYAHIHVANEEQACLTSCCPKPWAMQLNYTAQMSGWGIYSLLLRFFYPATRHVSIFRENNYFIYRNNSF